MTTDDSILATAPNPARQLRLDLSMAIQTLRPGDIIATASKGAASQGIQAVTASPFSHAILYWAGGRGIDATPQGGVSEASIRRKLQGAMVAAVFRHKTASLEQCERAAAWAALQVGKSYDAVGATRIGAIQQPYTSQLTRTALLVAIAVNLKGTTEEEHDASFFCSELIARAYQVADAPLFDGSAHLMGPGHVLHTNRLVYMGNLREVA